ncbi:MAG: hypothetical protein JXA33_02830 [Anaerolineae bacterium]|nr:hypothetical protein [Anaerolineae bacterium]
MTDHKKYIEERGHEVSPNFYTAEHRPLRSVPSPPRSIFWPVVLIGAGALLLLQNLGLFSAAGWSVLWRLWPLALIALGIDVMIGRRSLGGAIASTVLILLLLGFVLTVALFAGNVPWLVEQLRPAQLEYETVSYGLSGLESADVFIDWTGAPGHLSALDNDEALIEADVGYRGELQFTVTEHQDRANVVLASHLQGLPYSYLHFKDVETSWNVKLSPYVALDLRLDGGTGAGNFDLFELDITGLDVDVDSGDIQLTLPAHSSFTGKIDGGSGALTLILPEDVGLRIELDGGDGMFRTDIAHWVLLSGNPEDGVWETENYDSAGERIVLKIDQEAGDIRVR